MNTFSRAELQLLGSRTARAQVSLFMPTHPANSREDPIRLRNWLAQAETALMAQGLSAAEAGQILNPVRDRAGESGFWREGGPGLALFAGPDFLRILHLPLAFKEQLVIAPHFFVRPLLPLLAGAGAYYILALGQDSVKLLHFNGRDLRAVDLPKTARSRTGALQAEIPGKQVSPRTAGTAPAGGARPPALFYSSGGEVNVREQTVQFFHQVDKALRERLRDEPAPVILAGTDPLLALYRETSRAPGLAAEGIAGNAAGWSSQDLQTRAAAILEAERCERRARALDHYGRLSQTRRASHDIRAIAPAACQRRIETLFVEDEAVLWGHFDPAARAVAVHHDGQRPGDEDLLNLAVIETLWHGGEVWPMAAGALPGGEPAAAILSD